MKAAIFNAAGEPIAIFSGSEDDVGNATADERFAGLEQRVLDGTAWAEAMSLTALPSLSDFDQA